MRTIRHFASGLLTLGLLAAPFPLAAQTVMDGQTSGGAHYRIAVPDGWTPAAGLVIWNHGFSLAPIGPVDDLGPLAALQLSEGYAVAASSYSLRGWALFETAKDNQEMVEAFEAEFGVPDQVLVTGASLGGIVTAQAIEVGGLGNVVGALPVCGAVAGSRSWDGALDLRLIYDAVCGDVPGAAIPGGANGLPFPPDPDFTQTSMAVAVNVCTGVLLPEAARTPEQQARLDQILDVTGLPESFLITDVGYVTFGMADLVYDPRKLGGAPALDNMNVDYGDPEINASIERVAADPDARRLLLENYTPTGKVGSTRIVSLHTDGDGLVVLEQEDSYASVVPPGNLTVGVVVENEPSHCAFTEAEVVAAWESLRGWVAGLPQPTAADLQDTCEGIMAGGLAEGPCRIADDYDLPPIEDVIRPRSLCEEDGLTLCLGEDARFAVEATYTVESGTGSAVAGAIATADTGTFAFFDHDNIELTIKVIDGRQLNGHFWVFYASMTNVEFELVVTDTVTGLQKTYSNTSGSFASSADVQAF